jgi:hypothetical protein
MPITFACQGCAKQFKVPDEMAGRSSRCTQCGRPLVVPASPAAVAAWQPAPQPVAPAMAVPAPAPYDVAAGAPPAGGRFKISSKMLIIGGAGVLGLMLMVAMVWGGYKLFFGPSGLGDEILYLPNNCQTVVSVRPEQILNSDTYKDIKKELASDSDPEKNLEQLSGISLSNMQQVVIGMAATADGGQPDVVFVVKTVKPVSADDIKGKKMGMTPQETKVRDITVYEVLGISWCLPESKLVVIGKSDTLKKILERNKSAELSEGLRAALKYADFSKSITMAVDSKEMYAKMNEANKKNGIDLDKVFDKIGIANPMGDIDGGAYQIDVGKDIKFQSVMLCKDAKTAEDMRKISDGLATFLKRLFPKYGADSLETWESSVSGSRLTSSMTVKTDSIVKLIRAIKENIGKPANQTFQTVGQELGGPNNNNGPNNSKR